MIDLAKDANKICLKCNEPLRKHIRPTKVWPDNTNIGWVLCPTEEHNFESLQRVYDIEVRNPTTSELFVALGDNFKNIWRLVLLEIKRVI